MDQLERYMKELKLKRMIEIYREEAKRAAEEQTRREAEKLAKKQAKRVAKKQTKKEVGKTIKADHTGESEREIGSELYEGDVELAIVPFESFKQTNQFRKRLSTIDNLRIVSDSWSEDEGFIIIVSLKEPMALGSILQDIPDVEKVYREDEKVVVLFKTPEETQ